MDGAKIQLSPEEKQLISNSEWILTKNAVLAKVNALLALVLDEQMNWINVNKELFHPSLFAPPAKISRGENYGGLPYLVLDHPRVFGKPDTCVIRTFFWWGNYFSTTLQLEGSYRQRAEPRIVAAYEMMGKRNFLLGISTDRWQHRIDSAHYKPVKEFSSTAFGQMVSELPFIKISSLMRLDQWDDALQKLGDDFRVLASILSSPAGETDLSPGDPKAGFGP